MNEEKIMRLKRNKLWLWCAMALAFAATVYINITDTSIFSVVVLAWISGCCGFAMGEAIAFNWIRKFLTQEQK